ncbi:MAG: dihydroorotate dehydrogenase electron transfer subunit [Saccharofermentans sp.]|nr:dihydroorotate dehydrogenase electron transfer subunit [Saccharofermentans sp.]
MNKEFTCTIVSRRMISEDTAYLTISCPEIASSAIPGQFVNVSCSRFLKRPFGIAHTDTSNGTFDIGIKIVGDGTKELSDVSEGDTLNVLGPLGNGFDLSCADRFILVSGGTGVFPVNFAYEKLTESGKDVTLVQGFRDASQALMMREGAIITTDAGDLGIKGTCIAGLDTVDVSEGTVVCCVGPVPMMKAVGEWATGKGLRCFISMEQRMACGVGICLVCVCKIKAEEEGKPFEHVRCCKDGPVFDYKEIIL